MAGRRRKSEMTEEGSEPVETIPLDDSPVEMDVPAEPKPVEPEPAPVDKPAAPAAPAAPEDHSLDNMLASIFSSSVRTSVPTLITYIPNGASTAKHVIVDINQFAIEQGWITFKKMCPSGTPEDFLLRVYHITHTEIPRMYRAVATYTLSKN